MKEVFQFRNQRRFVLPKLILSSTSLFLWSCNLKPWKRLQYFTYWWSL